MFESLQRLERDIADCLTAIRGLVGSRYACLVDGRGVRFEDPPAAHASREIDALRRLIEERRVAVLSIPHGLAADASMDDVFEGWEAEELFLAIINERVALVVAGPDAERLRERSRSLVRAMTDRLLRYDSLYRMNPRGGGFFFGRPKLDLIVVSRSET